MGPPEQIDNLWSDLSLTRYGLFRRLPAEAPSISSATHQSWALSRLTGRAIGLSHPYPRRLRPPLLPFVRTGDPHVRPCAARLHAGRAVVRCLRLTPSATPVAGKTIEVLGCKRECAEGGSTGEDDARQEHERPAASPTGR